MRKQKRRYIGISILLLGMTGCMIESPNENITPTITLAIKNSSFNNHIPQYSSTKERRQKICV